MVAKRLQGAFASGSVLSDETHEGHHCESAVLDLLGLHLLHVILAHAHGVEGAAWVANLVGALEHALQAQEASRLTLRARLADIHPALAFCPAHEVDFDRHKGGVWEWRAGKCPLASVVPLSKARDDGTWNQDTSDCEHGKAAVDDLRLLVPLEGARSCRKIEWVEAVIGGQRAVQVLGRGGTWKPQRA